MRALIAVVTSVVVFQVHSALAASPEEARFLTAAKLAFEKHDADGLVALTCWDRVPQRIRQTAKRQYARAFYRGKAEITLTNADPEFVKVQGEWKRGEDPRFADFDPKWKEFGVTNRLNLPIVRQLKVKYGPIEEVGAVYTVSWSCPVGEKDGRLYFCEPAPTE